MNHDELTAFNPFNPKNLATQELEHQEFSLDGETIHVQPYILPHHNKTSQEEYQNYASEAGYLHNQGFYIYRNRRLIIKGTWFRLIKKDELNKLIRIRVDIPNTLDHLWMIDIKKSRAIPPESIKKELRQVINRIEDSGRKVYRQRGRKLKSNAKIPVWNRVAKQGIIQYEINLDYPLIRELLSNSKRLNKTDLLDLIKVIESSFPIDVFFNDIASKPESVQNPVLSEGFTKELIKIHMAFWDKDGLSSEELIARLASIEPFASNQGYLEKLKEISKEIVS